MRYHWIARVLGNDLIDPDAVMAPFATAVLTRTAADRRGIVLIGAKRTGRGGMMMSLGRNATSQVATKSPSTSRASLSKMARVELIVHN